MLAKLCPSVMAVRISGQRARIWPDFVAGFFPRLFARRSRVSAIHCCSALVYSSLFATIQQFTTYFDSFPQNSTTSGFFDKVRQFSTADSAVDWLEISSGAENTGS